MIIQVNKQEMTPKTFVRYVLCKVLEDTEHNFEQYATAVLPEYSLINEADKAKIDEWAHKQFTQMSSYLHKEDFANVNS